MAGDPPLKQVVTKTWEAGVRGQWGEVARWSAGVFRTENHDDILFVADNQAGFGYFKNFGKTRHQGMELALDGKAGVLHFGVNYTWLQATYQSREPVHGSANSSSDAEAPGLEGNIAITPGNRIPLTPSHILKAHVEVQGGRDWTVGLAMTAVSSSYARGNENNAHQAGGPAYLGAGKSGGYAVVELNGKYQLTRQLSVFAQVNNLFDRHYATAAQLGATGFDANGNFSARPAAGRERRVSDGQRTSMRRRPAQRYGAALRVLREDVLDDAITERKMAEGGGRPHGRLFLDAGLVVATVLLSGQPAGAVGGAAPSASRRKISIRAAQDAQALAFHAGSALQHARCAVRIEVAPGPRAARARHRQVFRVACLLTKPQAPPSSARAISCGVSCMLNTSTRTPASRAISLRSNSRPPMPGMDKSVTQTSGACSRCKPYAVSPLPASATTAMSPPCSSRRR